MQAWKEMNYLKKQLDYEGEQEDEVIGKVIQHKTCQVGSKERNNKKDDASKTFTLVPGIGVT